MTVFCMACGAQMQDTARFCPKCGTPAEASAAQVPPYQAQPGQPPVQGGPPPSQAHPAQQWQAPPPYPQQGSQPPQQAQWQPQNVITMGDESARIKPILILGVLGLIFAVGLTALGLAWWWVLLITVVGLLLNSLRFYFQANSIAKRTWQCPHCGAVIRMYKWYNCLFIPMMRPAIKIRQTCPQCNSKGWFTRAWGSN